MAPRHCRPWPPSLSPKNADQLSQEYLNVSECVTHIWSMVHNNIPCDILERDPPRMYACTYVHTYFVRPVILSEYIVTITSVTNHDQWRQSTQCIHHPSVHTVAQKGHSKWGILNTLQRIHTFKSALQNLALPNSHFHFSRFAFPNSNWGAPACVHARNVNIKLTTCQTWKQSCSKWCAKRCLLFFK